MAAQNDQQSIAYAIKSNSNNDTSMTTQKCTSSNSDSDKYNCNYGSKTTVEKEKDEEEQNPKSRPTIPSFECNHINNNIITEYDQDSTEAKQTPIVRLPIERTSFNSSSETVIEAAAPPPSPPTATTTEIKTSDEKNQHCEHLDRKNHEDSRQDMVLIESSLISNENHFEASKLNQEIDCLTIPSESSSFVGKRDAAVQVESGHLSDQKKRSTSGGSSKGFISTFLFKSMNKLWFNRDNVNNNGREANSNSNLFDREQAQTDDAGAPSEQQHQQHNSWFNQITQRYLLGRKWSSSMQASSSNRRKSHQQQGSLRQEANQLTCPLTQSAPATPVRWLGAQHRQHANIGADDPMTTNQQHQRVRFLGIIGDMAESDEAGAPVGEHNALEDEDDDPLGPDELDPLDEGEDEMDFGSKKGCELVEKLFQYLPADSATRGAGDTPTITDCVTDASKETIGDQNENLKSKLSDVEAEKSLHERMARVEGECPMDSSHFQHYGYRLIDYICNYLDTIKDRRVTPLNIEPGYLKSLIEPAAPVEGEPFPKIMQDFEKHIMCGITHWQHPRFHAYFPAGNAYPSILADMLSGALGCMGFSWAASPAYTELEIIMLDWMGKLIGLPDEFLCLSGSGESKGGGVIQGSASECVLVNLLAARHWAIERLRPKYPGLPDGMLLGKLIGYCSKEAHSAVEKAAMIGLIRMRGLDTDEHNSLRGETLENAIKSDLEQGLEPFLVCATLGTTSCVSFDNLDELGTICKLHDIWLHVDAAYAGSALICPEFKYLIKGIEKVTSINTNPNKWMLINFDCSLMWVKDRFKLTRAFVVDPLYLQHSYSDQAIDYRHWGIPLSRRFRALKLWFVIRNYGITGIQGYIRNHVSLAKLFESLIRTDSRFEITNQVVLGLVCFRLIGSNSVNQRLLSAINASGRLHMVPASVKNRFVIRFCVCDQNAKEEDIRYAFRCITEFATDTIESLAREHLIRPTLTSQHSVAMACESSTSETLLDNNIKSNNRNINVNTSHPHIGYQLAESSTGPGQLRLSPSDLDLIESHFLSLGFSPLSASMDSSRAPSATHANPQANLSAQQQTSSLLAEALLTSSGSASLVDSRLTPTTDLNASPGSPSNVASSLMVPRPSSRLTKQRSMVAGETDYEHSNCNSSELYDESLEQPRELCHANTIVGSGPSDETNPNPLTLGLTSNQQQQQDEQMRLAQRRARISGRYKRKFFVRVVSDPRVYRASISGDVNGHSPNGSLGGSIVNKGSQASIHNNRPD